MNSTVFSGSKNLTVYYLPNQFMSLTNGSSYFSEPAWTNYPGRYYRFRSP